METTCVLIPSCSNEQRVVILSLKEVERKFQSTEVAISVCTGIFLKMMPSHSTVICLKITSGGNDSKYSSGNLLVCSSQSGSVQCESNTHHSNRPLEDHPTAEGRDVFFFSLYSLCGWWVNLPWKLGNKGNKQKLWYVFIHLCFCFRACHECSLYTLKVDILVLD